MGRWQSGKLTPISKGKEMRAREQNEGDVAKKMNMKSEQS